jgi:tryptophanyl-tRNA synthetase
MKRILSGIRANNEPTLGNYLGALKPWVALTGRDSDNQYFFFIPNLHSLNNRNAAQLRSNTLSNVAWYLAAGIDPGRVTLYAQSQIPAHSELAWIFNNYVTMGELNRQTQYKEKLQKGSAEGQLVSLFTYPTLMAADILLYDADEVPVGDDQRQHVELARDIATRFNNSFGPTFKLPSATPPETGARVMNLQDPTSKMSKSDDDQSGNILLTDSMDEIRRKVKRAVTDSDDEIKAAKDKPALTNLLHIYSSTTGQSIPELESTFREKGYGQFKEALAEAIVQHLEPVQKRHDELMSDQHQLMSILEEGREKAIVIAGEKLAEVKQKIGLL